MQSAITHPATTAGTAEPARSTGRPATRPRRTVLASATALLRAFARSCRDARLPETPSGAAFSTLPRGEQNRLLNRGYRP